MNLISCENVIFQANRISIKAGNKTIEIEKKNIWTMFYAKWSFRNFFTIGNEGITMGILYIAKKDTMKLKDVIRIRFPYKELERIPKQYFDQIDFYEFGKTQNIFQLDKW